MMSQKNPKPVLLIAGPTASGKSALAMKLARERGGVIINADSMQVYADLRLLTARPTAQEEQVQRHMLYGHVSATQSWSVANWLAEAKSAIESCWAEGHLPIITGGTGLYFKALEQGLTELPPIAAEIRDYWRNFTGDLHAELAKRDGVGAAKLNPSDRTRLIRALEVVDATGRPLHVWHELGKISAPLADAHVERHFVTVARAELYARAEQRFDQMLAHGALDEVRHLPPLDENLPVMKAIGLRELRACLSGTLTMEEAADLAKTATRQYIKRQLTWWRGQMTDWPVN
jgi:tRNA dimethylallyltransferase